jgi:hypothetical protein
MSQTRLIYVFFYVLRLPVIETFHTRSAEVLKETAALVPKNEYVTPEDKQIIIERVHALSPRTNGLPAAAVNKYKR